MKIEKTFTVAAPQNLVWDFITSPEKVAPCIPGCEGTEETAEGQYKATISTKVGPVKAKFHVDIETEEERAPEFAKYLTKGEEGSKASRIKATSTLALTEISASETEVTYASDVNIMGRLGKFGSGMMGKVADSIGEQFVAELKNQLEKDQPEEPANVETETEVASNPFNWQLIATSIVVVLLLASFMIWI